MYALKPAASRIHAALLTSASLTEISLIERRKTPRSTASITTTSAAKTAHSVGLPLVRIFRGSRARPQRETRTRGYPEDKRKQSDGGRTGVYARWPPVVLHTACRVTRTSEREERTCPE